MVYEKVFQRFKGWDQWLDETWSSVYIQPAEIFLYKPREQKVFPIWNYNKSLNYLFKLHLNTVSMLWFHSHYYL